VIPDSAEAGGRDDSQALIGRVLLYSHKINPKTGKRRTLETPPRAAAEWHQRAIQFFKCKHGPKRRWAMATRQDTSKPQEQTKQPAQQTGQPDQQAKQTGPNRPAETGMAPYRGGAPMARSGGWEPLARLHDEFDRLFDQLSRGMIGMPAAMPAARWDTGWGIDMREDENNVIVRAEAPGFEASDFDIRVHGDRLVMCACRGSEEEEEGYRGWRRSEFSESLTLPADVDADKVKAAYRNGVLTVTLPKTEEGKAKRITVES
jgi:HSP20 family protein